MIKEIIQVTSGGLFALCFLTLMYNMIFKEKKIINEISPVCLFTTGLFLMIYDILNIKFIILYILYIIIILLLNKQVYIWIEEGDSDKNILIKKILLYIGGIASNISYMIGKFRKN